MSNSNEEDAKDDNYVRTPDGKIHNFMLRVGGKPFWCHCHCNVFCKPDKSDLNKYECNSCGETYHSE